MKKVDLATALARLQAKRGEVTPEIYVEEATDPQHELHNTLDWDNEKLGHAHRLVQARAHIRSVQFEVVRDGKTYTPPVYVRNPDREQRQQGYVSLKDITPRSRTAREVLADELDRIVSLLERTLAIAASLGLEADVKALHKHAIEVAALVREPEKEDA